VAGLTILVTGATGTVGSHVVRELSARGAAVRAFVRDPGRAAARVGPDVELVQGDFGEMDSIRRQLRDVDALFLACGNQPRQVELETNVIHAAAAAGVPRVVKLSARGAEVGSGLGFWDWQGRIESALEASRLPAVVLRPGNFMSNLLGSADTVRHAGRLFAPAAGARSAMIDPRDVAAAAATVLTESGHEGRIYTLTGPADITYEEVARELSLVTGRDVEFVPVPDDVARDAFEEAGMPTWLADNLVKLFALIRAGATAGTTEDVRLLTGRTPRGFGEFARDHAWAFGG
jgi:uncharacterized protein YbjT (DUF2867 family)